MPLKPIACDDKRTPPLFPRPASRLPSAVLAAALAIALSGTSPVWADVPPVDHAAHHPIQAMTQPAPMAMQGLTYAPLYGAGQYAAPTDVPKTATSAMPSQMPASPAASTQMAGNQMASGSGPSQMMAMMGEMSMPQPAFYPSLMAMPQVGPEQRLSLEMQSRQSISAGAALMTDGLVQLSRRTADADAVAIRNALDLVKQGAALTEAGLSGQRVLTGEAPQQVALGWFRRQMNMPSLAETNDQWIIYGLTPFHLTVMVALILASITLIFAYIYRMGTAVHVFRRLSTYRPHMPHRANRTSNVDPTVPGSDPNPDTPPVAEKAPKETQAPQEPATPPFIPQAEVPQPNSETPAETVSETPEAIEVVFSRSGRTVTLQSDETLFDAAERAEVEIGGRCMEGTCNGCKIRVIQGNILTEGEEEVRFVRDTMVLACQSHPRGKVIVRA